MLTSLEKHESYLSLFRAKIETSMGIVIKQILHQRKL